MMRQNVQIDYILAYPWGFTETATLFHTRTLTVNGLKRVLKRLGYDHNAKYVESIDCQGRIANAQP
jgi:hypothetical protein